MRKLTLIVVTPEGESRVEPGGDGDAFGEFVVGRSADADLFLNDPGISRKHCAIRRRDDGGVEVEDLGSRAGTWRNGRRTEGVVVLRNGDELRVGGLTLRVELEGTGFGGEPTVPPPVAPRVAPPPDATIVAGPDQRAAAAASVPRISVDLAPEPLVIGRDESAGIRLDHVLVSRRHAEVWIAEGTAGVRDLGSTNGTFVNGQLVREPVGLRPGDVLGVGPFDLRFDGRGLRSTAEAPGMRIEVRGVGKEVNDRETGKPLFLLKGLNLTIEPKEFVGFFGPSGCGKSTFMDTMNGRRPATEGEVLYNGQNLYNNFDSFKRGIGYVPQELIFHQQLPVGDVLRYASRLRLPDDTTDEEIESNIDRVLQIVGLLKQKGTLVQNLSGGQKKRVSIGIELLSRPRVLFLDEATSGLDLGTEAQMMRLFRELAEGGVTTLCITHYVDSLDGCDMVACLMAGRLAFWGPPDELKKYFGVSAIREVYLKENEHTPEEWEEKFRKSKAYRKYVEGRASAPRDSERTVVRPGQQLEQVRPSDPVRQFKVLTKRYVQVIASDRRNVLLMFALAPVIGMLASMVLSGSTGGTYAIARRQAQLSFTMSLTMIFLGIFGGIREIVKEVAVYRHERFVNLEIMPYLGSKVIPLSVIAAVQAALLLLTVHLFVDMRANIIGQFVILFPTAVGALLLGLAISAAVDSADKAILLMILVLIPQLLFSNAFIQLEDFGKFVACAFILCYWSHDGLKSLLPDHFLRLKTPGSTSPMLFGHNGWFLDLLMILLFAAIYGVLAWWFLRRKDGPYGKPFQMPFVKVGSWVEAKTRMTSVGRSGVDTVMKGIRSFRKKP